MRLNLVQIAIIGLVQSQRHDQPEAPYLQRNEAHRFLSSARLGLAARIRRSPEQAEEMIVLLGGSREMFVSNPDE